MLTAILPRNRIIGIETNTVEHAVEVIGALLRSCEGVSLHTDGSGGTQIVVTHVHRLARSDLLSALLQISHAKGAERGHIREFFRRSLITEGEHQWYCDALPAMLRRVTPDSINLSQGGITINLRAFQRHVHPLILAEIYQCLRSDDALPLWRAKSKPGRRFVTGFTPKRLTRAILQHTAATLTQQLAGVALEIKYIRRITFRSIGPVFNTPGEAQRVLLRLLTVIGAVSYDENSRIMRLVSERSWFEAVMHTTFFRRSSYLGWLLLRIGEYVQRDGEDLVIDLGKLDETAPTLKQSDYPPAWLSSALLSNLYQLMRPEWVPSADLSTYASGPKLVVLSTPEDKSEAGLHRWMEQMTEWTGATEFIFN